MVVALSRILDEREEARARGYVKKAGYDVLAGCLHEGVAYREALNRGLALTETRRGLRVGTLFCVGGRISPWIGCSGTDDNDGQSRHDPYELCRCREGTCRGWGTAQCFGRRVLQPRSKPS